MPARMAAALAQQEAAASASAAAESVGSPPMLGAVLQLAKEVSTASAESTIRIVSMVSSTDRS